MNFPFPLPWLIAALLALLGSWTVDLPTAEQIHKHRLEQLAERARPHIKRGHEERVLQWVEVVERHFDTDRDVVRALCIISYESGGNENANRDRSNRNAKGMWQHLARYWEGRSRNAGVPGASMWDVEAQTIVAAHLVYNTRGSWQHWVVWRNCL